MRKQQTSKFRVLVSLELILFWIKMRKLLKNKQLRAYFAFGYFFIFIIAIIFLLF